MTRSPAPRLLCLVLSLLLGLWGIQTVQACPGEALVAVVACGHDGVIWLDATGQPAKPCPHCPEGLGTAALDAPRSPLAPWSCGGFERLAVARPSLTPRLPQLAFTARGPPSCPAAPSLAAVEV